MFLRRGNRCNVIAAGVLRLYKVIMRRKSRLLAMSAGLAFLAGVVFAGCNAQKIQINKRIKAVETSLFRVVYLKGLKLEKLSLAGRMAFYKVPGVSIAAVDKNSVELARAYGVKDAQTQQQLTKDAVFQGGAFSQIIASAAALRLVEQGKLDLEGDIGRQLKSYELPPEAPSRSLTPKALMTHSAGFSDQIFSGYAPDEPLPLLRQILDGEKPANNGPVWVPPARPLAANAQYSESGYVLLQLLLEDVAAEPFASFVHRTVINPLAMSRSSFAAPLPAGLKSEAASGHLREGQTVPNLWNTYPESAAKGLWTTAPDFAAFLSDLLQAAMGKPGKVLSSGAARVMLSPQVENFGFGFLVEGMGDDIQFNLRGKTRGFACYMVLYPAKGQGAVIMTNSDNGFFLIQEILAAFAEVYKWPHYKPEEKPVLRLAPESYQQYIGRYEVNPNYVLDVTREDYYLVIRPTGQSPTRFYAESQTLFYSTDPYIRIQFLSDRMNGVDSLVLWQQDFELQAKKIL
jgi:CubicO group peptidase (beta-lactamase class C family)